jgi:hypothetical protein
MNRDRKNFDVKRKGILMFCRKCDAPTYQVAYGTMDKQIQKFEENRIKVSKLHYFVCSECGEFNSRDRW